ncbi:MAG TPA: gamma-glutamyltransferase, partial [Flavisolibacter sp.]|nr:gamma-glutamyltransferase [Flavisolibacter sp.]
MYMTHVKLLLIVTFSAHFLAFGQTGGKIIDPQNINPYQYTAQKNVLAKNGAVTSAHPLASKVGVEIMKEGGNAIDAAIATQLALAVVYPNAGNIGGGGFMVARLANGKTLALDYREMAPSSASRDMYLDANGNVIPGKSINGHLSCGIPGTIAGLFA